MNAGIQGLAADIFKVALVRLDDTLEERGLASRIVLQVHDEILLEAVEEEREEAIALTVDSMEHASELRVPLRCTWLLATAGPPARSPGRTPRATSTSSTNWTTALRSRSACGFGRADG